MCGIAGFTHLNARPHPDRIQAVTKSLHHRGPDQSGVWEDDAVSLGAVRLKILDLSGGDQPIVSPSGRTVIVYNGEIYNHAAVRAELEALGHRFTSHCDTEVLLHAFEQWDTKAFAKMRGMFAAALWQPAERRLMLVRDRVGIKPLYLCQRGDDLYFGSELKAILGHPEIPRVIDEHGLSYYLSLNYVPTPYTLVEGITKLRPGHWLEWRAGQITTECYWIHSLWPSPRAVPEAKEQLDTLLRDAIKEHLISDVPLGIWASGGLDSSAVLHYAAEQAGRRLKTFSVSFRGRKFDESPYFREVAQRYGTDHHEFDLNPEQDLPGAIQEIVTYSDEPSADAGALPVWFLSKMSRAQVTVALSGEGADELFAGYKTYVADDYARQARRAPAWIRQAGLAAMRLWPSSDDKISFEYKVKRFLTGSLLDEQSAHLSWNGTFTDQERKALYQRDGSRTVRDLFRWLPGEFARSGELNRFLWLDQRYYLADDILTKCDRMSMAHSLEVRPPFLDHRVIEFANTLPEDLKIRGGELKWLLRDLMRDKLPAAVLTRPKEGFDIPAHDWFRTILKPLFLDTVNERSVSETGLFDWKVLQGHIDRHMRRRASLGYHLWGLLILFLWMKRWNIRAAA